MIHVCLCLTHAKERVTEVTFKSKTLSSQVHGCFRVCCKRWSYAALLQQRRLEMFVYSLFQSHGWCDQETEFQLDSSYFKSKWSQMVSDISSGQYRYLHLLTSGNEMESPEKNLSHGPSQSSITPLSNTPEHTRTFCHHPQVPSNL